MKQAPGIQKIEYKILGSQTIHEIPCVKNKSTCDATTDIVKGSDISTIKLSFKVVENTENATFIADFLKNIRQLLLFRVYFTSEKVSVVGSKDFRTTVKIKQDPGEKAGDFVGYFFEVSWSHPLFM